MSAELILHNAKIGTNRVPSFVEAVAITAGKITAAGKDDEILRLRGPQTRVVDGRKRTVIPGLNDSHMHPIRGGLNYNMELRWDGVPSLSDALRMLKDQAGRTPAPQWVRVVGGWTEFQFAERRMPTLDEINAAAPDTPVFVMHLYDRVLLNVLTIVGGKIVYATQEFSKLAPPALPVSPRWSPVKDYGGYARGQREVAGASHSASCSHVETSATSQGKSHLQVLGDLGLWGLGCDCFAF